MPILRSIAGVILGYMIFAISGGLLFALSGQKAHGIASLTFMIGSVVYGAFFALVGGYVSGLIAGRKPLAHGIAVAAVLAMGATASLLATIGKGSIWSQVSALLVMAPSASVGGRLRARRN